MKFLSQLRERRLFQIMVSYGAVAWALLEVTSQLVERGLLGELVYRIVLIWVVGGIPAALLIGWFHGEKGRQKAPPSEIVALIGLAILVVGMSAFTVNRHIAAAGPVVTADELDLRRLAVLYFSDMTPGEAYRHVADALTEDLITELRQVRALDVVSRNGVAPFRGEAVPADSVARALHVGTVVAGSIEPLGNDRLRVHVRILDGGSGAEFRRTSFERPVAEVLALREQLVETTAGLLREWMGEEVRTRRTARATASAAAWTLYQRAERTRKEADRLIREEHGHGADEAFLSADSLLAQAELADPAWADPPVLRANIAYRQALQAHDTHASVGRLEAGITHADRALALERNHARALEMRGSLRYVHWLLRVVHDPAQQDRLIRLARDDLESAVQVDPSLASAHAMLSHMFMNLDDQLPSAVLAAQRAYEEDAYLERAEQILDRLFYGTFNLGQFSQAARWCETGARRFPADYRFSLCQLHLMTAPGGRPDVDAAWRLVARIDSIAPASRRDFRALHAEILAAGAIARADEPDSARAVLARARGRIDHEVDPEGELNWEEAYVRIVLGDHDEAIDVLRAAISAHPEHRFALGRRQITWRWQDLQSHPRFWEISGR